MKIAPEIARLIEDYLRAVEDRLAGKHPDVRRELLAVVSCGVDRHDRQVNIQNSWEVDREANSFDACASIDALEHFLRTEAATVAA